MPSIKSEPRAPADHQPEDDAPPPEAPEEDEGFSFRTLWEVIRESYLTMDRRTLGFTRILLGFLLLCDLRRRTTDWLDMYSNQGVLPNHVILFRPQSDGFSIFHAFSTRGELWALWAVGLVAFTCLFLGYKTKVAQVVSLVFVTSINGRVLLIENGGYVVQNLLLLWTCFLPMGDRFSLDALLASMRRTRETSAEELNDRGSAIDPRALEPHVSLLGLALVLQLAAIYYFNVVHKTGPNWKNGTAVHYVIYVDRMVTPLIPVVRDHIPNWLVIFLTKMTMVFEAALPVCLLSPLGRVWARRFVVAMMNALHIAFGSVFTLGPFAWSACTFSTLMFGREDWEIAERTMRRPHRGRTVLFDPGVGFALFACRLLKRCDRLELLRFEERAGAPHALAVADASGAQATGARALADALAALPLGPIPAAFLRLPGVRGACDLLLGRLDARALSRFFGLAPAGARRLPQAPQPSALHALGSRVTGFARELGVAVMLLAAMNQAAVELWVLRPLHLPQPEPMRSLSHKMRFLQGWFMFSPNPVMDDGTVVTDAETVDGRHIDPFTGKPPDFDLIHAKSLGLSQIWGDYYNRIHLPQNSAYREAMRDYILRYPERTGRPEDAVVAAEISWVHDMNPKWSTTESFAQEKTKVFAFDMRQGGSVR